MSRAPGQHEDLAPEFTLGGLLRRLGSLAWSHRWAAIPAILVTLIGQAVTLVSLTCQGLAIDVLRGFADDSAPAPEWPFGIAPPESWPFEWTLFALGGATLVAGLGIGVCRFFQTVADEHYVQVCVVELRSRLYARLQQLGYRFFDTHETGEIVQRLTQDVQSVRMFVQGVVVRLAITLISFSVFLTFMLREHVGLTLACITLVPLQAFVMARFGRKSKPAFLRQARLMDHFVHHFQESIVGSRVIRSFGRENERVEGAAERAGRARDHRVGIDRIRSTHIPAVMGATLAASAILLAYGGWLVLLGPANGGIALGTLWVFRGLLERLGSQAEAIAMVAASAPESLAGAERVFRLMEHPVDIEDVPEHGAHILGAVRFQDVWFAYEPGVDVLRGVDFEVGAGETIAIVGPTGCGKSTLLSLIARHYDADRGHVLIDERDVRDWPLTELRRSVAMVFQEPFLFSNTIARNVGYGAPTSDTDALLSAIDAASARDVLTERDRGLHTVIGERGVSLSGGQRQRLTIARALLMDAPILALDDATGAVDPITEGEIQHALDERTRGRTTFVVAHRLSTLRRADRIIVLEEGRIVDIGSHEELLGRAGHYRAAALIQLALDQSEEGATA